MNRLARLFLKTLYRFSGPYSVGRAFFPPPDAGPPISICMAVHDPNISHLKAAVDSVRSQTYSGWSLCISDDASTLAPVRSYLKGLPGSDPRIKLATRSERGHISQALNTALGLADTEFVTFLDHDDLLDPRALATLAHALAAAPGADFLYSDEDKIGPFGLRFQPYHKPDWNRELLLSQNYPCHLVAIRRALLLSAGGFRKGFEGAQDWDLILRLSPLLTPPRVVHLPNLLYHWRISSASTSLSLGRKPYAREAQLRAVREHLERAGQTAAVRQHPFLPFLEVDRTSANLPSFAMIPIEGQSGASARQRAEASWAEVLVFFHPRVMPAAFDSLKALVSQALRSEVGAAGGKVIDENGRLLSCGYEYSGTDELVMPGIGALGSHPGYFGRFSLARNVDALGHYALAIRRSVFLQTSGFSEVEDAERAAVALSREVAQAGLQLIFEPRATFRFRG